MLGGALVLLRHPGRQSDQKMVEVVVKANCDSGGGDMQHSAGELAVVLGEKDRKSLIRRAEIFPGSSGFDRK